MWKVTSAPTVLQPQMSTVDMKPWVGQQRQFHFHNKYPSCPTHTNTRGLFSGFLSHHPKDQMQIACPRQTAGSCNSLLSDTECEGLLRAHDCGIIWGKRQGGGSWRSSFSQQFANRESLYFLWFTAQHEHILTLAAKYKMFLVRLLLFP